MRPSEVERNINELKRKLDWYIPELCALRTVVQQILKGQCIPFVLKPFYIQLDGTRLGDLITLDEFGKRVMSGAFIDSDGVGRFATNDCESDIWVAPSTFLILRHYISPSLTHVMWFNK